jgi:ribonuclease D
MPYLTNANEIRTKIAEYAQAEILWVDTEVADYQTSKPRLSLIQVLDDPSDLTGDRVSILDVLDQPELAVYFIDKIMVNSAIQKVFHNASYDIKFLGKTKAKNVSCTLEVAKQIPYYILPVPDLKLQTLVRELCNVPEVDKSLQGSNWGQRPLTKSQLHYAKMDVVYLAQVDQQLLQRKQLSDPNPATEDITALSQRYRSIEQQWKLLDTELTHIKDRLKAAMQAKNISETDYFKLSPREQTTKKVAFDELAKLTQASGVALDFPLKLTKDLQKQLGGLIEQLPVEDETTTIWRLMPKEQEE